MNTKDYIDLTALKKDYFYGASLANFTTSIPATNTTTYTYSSDYPVDYYPTSYWSSTSYDDYYKDACKTAFLPLSYIDTPDKALTENTALKKKIAALEKVNADLMEVLDIAPHANKCQNHKEG